MMTIHSIDSFSVAILESLAAGSSLQAPSPEYRAAPPFGTSTPLVSSSLTPFDSTALTGTRTLLSANALPTLEAQVTENVTLGAVLTQLVEAFTAVSESGLDEAIAASPAPDNAIASAQPQVVAESVVAQSQVVAAETQIVAEPIAVTQPQIVAQPQVAQVAEPVATTLPDPTTILPDPKNPTPTYSESPIATTTVAPPQFSVAQATSTQASEQVVSPSSAPTSETPVVTQTEHTVVPEIVRDTLPFNQLPVSSSETPVAVNASVVAQPQVVVAQPQVVVSDGKTGGDFVSAVTPSRMERETPESSDAQKVASPSTIQDAIPSVMPQVAVAPDIAPAPASEAPSTASASAIPAPAAVTATFVDAANAVADTILVTPTLLRDNSGAIQVQLKPEVLGGSVLSIDITGREMTITFTVPQTAAATTSTSQDIAAYLTAALPQLQAHLAEKIPSFNVVVNVQTAANTFRKKSDDRA